MLGSALMLDISKEIVTGFISHHSLNTTSESVYHSWTLLAGSQPKGGSRGAITPFETYESIFFHHDFVQFGKQHSRCRTILQSIVLSQHLSYNSEPAIRLDGQILLKSHLPLNLLADPPLSQQMQNRSKWKASHRRHTSTLIRKTYVKTGSGMQNRRQKFFNSRALLLCTGLDIQKIW